MGAPAFWKERDRSHGRSLETPPHRSPAAAEGGISGPGPGGLAGPQGPGTAFVLCHPSGGCERSGPRAGGAVRLPGRGAGRVGGGAEKGAGGGRAHSGAASDAPSPAGPLSGLPGAAGRGDQLAGGRLRLAGALLLWGQKRDGLCPVPGRQAPGAGRAAGGRGQHRNGSGQHPPDRGGGAGAAGGPDLCGPQPCEQPGPAVPGGLAGDRRPPGGAGPHRDPSGGPLDLCGRGYALP